MRIADKVVLITGASEGIGAACARVFRRRGALLSLTARSIQETAGIEALVTPGDLTDGDFRRRLVERTLERFGRVDVLVNNAAVGLYTPAATAPMPLVRQMFELNLFAALEMIQMVAPAMKRQRSGAIVNVSSIAGKVTLPWLTLYSATKHALCSLGEGLRTELKPFGIQVTTVCPGHVKTAFGGHALDGRQPARLVRHHRFTISAERCAEAIVRGVERGTRTVMTPRVAWVLVGLDRLFPALVDWQLGRIQQDVEQG